MAKARDGGERPLHSLCSRENQVVTTAKVGAFVGQDGLQLIGI
jgi:hypothetical protein